MPFKHFYCKNKTDSTIISQMMTSKAYNGFSESEILHFEAQLRKILSNLE